MRNLILKKISAISLALILLCFSLVSCSERSEFSNEIAAVDELSSHIDEEFNISVLDRHNISENDLLYYVRLARSSTPKQEEEFIIFFSSDEKVFSLSSISSLSEELEEYWNEVKNARPERSFSPEEIETILALVD